MFDLRELTDQELDQIRRDAMQEQERRENLVTIPNQIAELKEKYVEGGGNAADLEDL